MSLSLNLKVGLQGRFGIKVHGADGCLRFETEFDNLLLNQGLDWYGNMLRNLNSGNDITPWGYYYCGMGTGTTPPAVTDTQLENMLGSVTQTTEALSVGTDSPRYGQRTVTYVFAPGSFGASSVNLTEIGVGPDLDTFPWLIARQLIKNPAGDTITLTILPQETVTVTYVLRLYIPETDVVQVLDVDTVGGPVSTTFTIRATGAASGSIWNFPKVRVKYSETPDGNASIGLCKIYSNDFALSALDDAPTASKTASRDALVNPDPDDYILGSYTNVGTVSWNAENPTGGFTDDEVGGSTWYTTLGGYQILFSPPITKRDVDQLDMQFRLTWGRYIP